MSNVHKTKTKLYMWDLGQCDPKKCSGRKLAREKLIKILPITASFHGIVLTPDSSASLFTPSDIEIIQKAGIAVIDCSWNEYSAGRGVDQVKKLKYHNGRFLPFLLAGNPINHGRPYKLNCAEALAGALAICGLMDDAFEIMNVFGWGQTFLDINQNVVEEYQQCKTIEDVIAVQKAYTEDDEDEEERRARKERERAKMFDIPSSSSEEEEFYNPNKINREDDDDEEEEEEEEENEEYE